MPEGGKITSLNPGIIARALQTVRFLIDPSNGVPAWFGAGQPLVPQAQEQTVGRRWDYPTYYNTVATNPRGSEPISFQDLRNLADNCDVLRAVIETRKDQVEAQDWSIRVKRIDGDTFKPKPTADQTNRITAITNFFQSPDKEVDFSGWIRQILEDLFVIDAVTLYKRRDRVGRLYSLDLIDGATIRPLITDDGRVPLAPQPAYQQILHGVQANDLAAPDPTGDSFTKDELIYRRYNPRSFKVYGYSPVEQILITVNIAIRRSLFQLDYYNSGSTPDSFGTLPADWTTQQIVDFQTSFNAMMSGNLAARRQMKFMPEAFKYTETKSPPMKDEYDEWLARVICFVFSIAPTPFIKTVNRATAENARDQAREEGLMPLLKRLASLMNSVINTEFKSPDLEFTWVDDREQDAKAAADIRQGDVKTGIISIDEAREQIGEDSLGGAYAIPMALTATGFVAIKSPDEQDADAETNRQTMLQAKQNNQEDDKDGSDTNSDNPTNPADKQKQQKLAKRSKKKLPNRYSQHDHSPLSKKKS